MSTRNIPRPNGDSRTCLDVAGLTEQLVAIRPRPATEAEILMLHEPDHLDRMKAPERDRR